MKKLVQLLLSTVALALVSGNAIHAQEASSNPLDTVYSIVEQSQSDIKDLKKIKFSGYIQAQYQKSDTIGSPSVAGGDFKNLDNRFQIRRARLKAAYTGENTQIVTQFDLKDDGSVKVKEAYGVYSEPYLKTFTATVGLFNRPIGLEVEYSSSMLESPERSRIMQTLFPDECDMGAKLTIQAPKTSSWNFIKLDVGLLNGNAIASETDKYKDIVAHLSLKKTLLSESLLLSAGASYYNGGWANQSGNVYKYNTDSVAFVKDGSYKKGDKVERKYLGLDFQAILNSDFGMTTLRGEYLWGTQAGTKGSSVSPKGAMNNSAKEYIIKDTASGSNNYIQVTSSGSTPADAYIREFSGGYVLLAHRLMQTKHEFVFKYDWYDPNTKADGDQVGQKTYINKTKTTPNAISNTGDIKFTTIGLGWNYYLTSNLKFSVYYDMVKNETTKNSANLLPKDDISGKVKDNGTTNYGSDLKDNVLTIRALYKF